MQSNCHQVKISCVGLPAAVPLVIVWKTSVGHHLYESRRRLRAVSYFGEELPSLMLDSVIVNMLEDLEEHEYLYVQKKVLSKEYTVRGRGCRRYRGDNLVLTHIPGECRGRGGGEYLG